MTGTTVSSRAGATVRGGAGRGLDVPEPAGAARTAKLDRTARLAQTAVTIGQQVVLVPLLLHTWGVARYDHWLAAFAAAQFMALIDFGYEPHLSNGLTAAKLRGSRRRYERMIAEGAGTYLLLALAGCLIAAGTHLVLTAVGPPASVPAGDAGLVAGLLVTIACLLPTCVFTAVARAEGAYYLGIAYRCLTDISLYAALAATAATGFTPVQSVAAMTACVLVVGWGLPAADLRRRFGVRVWQVRAMPRRRLAALPRACFGYQLARVYHIVFASGPVLVVASMSTTPGVLTTFAVCRTFIGVVRQIVLGLSQATGVATSRLYFENRLDELRFRAASSTLELGLLCGGLVGIAVAVSPLFIPLWTHGEVGADLLLVISLGLSILATFPAFVAEAFGHFAGTPNRAALARTLQNIVGLGLGAALLPVLGIGGMGLALAVAEVTFVSVGVIQSGQRPVRILDARTVQTALLLALAVAGVFAATMTLLHAELAQGRAQIYGLLALAALLSGALILGVIFYDRLCQQAFHRLGLLVPPHAE